MPGAFGTADEATLLAAAKEEPGTDGVDLVATVTTAGPFAVRSGWVTTVAFWILISPTDVAALSGLTSSVCASFPAPQAESGATETTMAAAARAPRRRLLLTAAATP